MENLLSKLEKINAKESINEKNHQFKKKFTRIKYVQGQKKHWNEKNEFKNTFIHHNYFIYFFTMILPYVTKKFLMNFNTLIFLFIIIFMEGITELKKIQKYTMYVSINIISFILQIILEILIRFNKFQFGLKNNTKKYQVLTAQGGDIWIEKNEDQLQNGDIIKLQNLDVSPATIIILTNHHRIHKNDYCLVENFYIDEKIKIIKKSSIRKLKPKFLLDKPEHFKRYCKYLTFHLEYQIKNSDFSDFEGLLKIRKDPKPESISERNIIKRESIIRSNWVMGIIINHSKESDHYNFFAQFKKSSFIEKTYNKLNKAILIIIFLVIVALFFLKTQMNFFSDNTVYIISCFIILLLFPLNINLFILLYQFIISHQINYEYNSRQKRHQKLQKINSTIKQHKLPMFKKPTLKSENENQQPNIQSKNHTLKIINPNSLSNLSNLGSIVYTKSMFFTQKNFILKSISNYDSYYLITYQDQEQKSLDLSDSISKIGFITDNFDQKSDDKSIAFSKKTFERKSKNLRSTNLLKSGSSKKIIQPSRTLNTNQLLTQKTIINKDINFTEYHNQAPTIHKKVINLSTLAQNNNLLNKNQFLMTLLQNIALVVDCEILQKNIETQKIDSKCYIDQSILRFYEKFNSHVKILRYMPNQSGYNIYSKLGNQQIKTKILCISSNFQAKSLKVYYKLQNKNNIFLMLRTTNLDLAFNSIQCAVTKRNLQEIFINNGNKNLKSLYYLTKKIPEKESLNIYSNFVSYSKKKMNPIEYLEKQCSYFWNDMVLYCVFGIKEQIYKEIPFIHKFQEANIRICFLTHSNLSFANQIQVLLRQNCLNQITIRFMFQNSSIGKQLMSTYYSKYQQVFKTIISDDIPLEKKINNFMNGKITLSDKKFFLIISGKTFTIIIKDPHIYYHFKFFLHYSSCIVTYDFTSEQKAQLVDLIQQLEGKSVMAVGQGSKDFQMMQQANISAQIKEDSQNFTGDIIFTNPHDLNTLIFTKSHNIFSNFFQIFFQMMYFTFFFLGQIIGEFFFGNNYEIFFPNYLSLLIPQIYVFLIGITITLKEECEDFSQHSVYYHYNFIIESQTYSYIVLNFIEGFIIGLYNIVVIDISAQSFQKGSLQFQKNDLFTLIILTDTILLCFKVLIYQKKYSKIVFLCWIGFCSFTIGSVYLLELFVNDQTHISFRLIFELEIIMLLCNNILFCGMIIYVIQVYLRDIHLQFFSYMKIFKGVLSEHQILKQFVLNMFSQMRQTFFPQILYKIYSIKYYIDSYLMGLTYPSHIFEGNNIINKYTLKMNNDFLEKTFYFFEYTKEQLIKCVIKFVHMFFLLFLSFTCYIFEREMDIMVGIIILIICILTHVLLENYSYNMNSIYLSYKIIYYITEISVLLSTFDYKKYYLTLIIGQSLFSLFLTNYQVMEVFFSSFIKIILTILHFIYFTKHYSFNVQNLLVDIATIYIIIFITDQKFRHIRFKKKNLILKFRLKKKENYNNHLLKFLMPGFIIDKLNFDVDETYFADDAGEVVVMFLYICKFNEILNAFKDDIIVLLDQIFKDFDILCENHGVKKIETVSNSYVAACGGSLGEEILSKQIKQKPPIQRMFELATQIVKIVNEHKDHQGQKIQVKIGIHTGKCMMGVIGYHKPQFSLIGDTINTTSRVCTTGIDGHIMLSQEAFNKLKKTDFEKGQFESNSVMTFMKGKGNQPIYHFFKEQQQKNFKRLMNLAMKKMQNNNIQNNTTALERYQVKKNYQNALRQIEYAPQNENKITFIRSMSKKQLSQEFQIESRKPKKIEIENSISQEDDTIDFSDEDEPEKIEYDLINKKEFYSYLNLNNATIKQFFEDIQFSQSKYYTIFFMTIIVMEICIILILGINYKLVSNQLGIFILKCLLQIIPISLMLHITKITHNTIYYYNLYIILNLGICFLFSISLDFPINLNVIFCIETFMISLIQYFSIFFNFLILLKFVIFYFIMHIFGFLMLKIYLDAVNETFNDLGVYLFLLICFDIISVALMIVKYQIIKQEVNYYKHINIELHKNSQINDFINRLMPEHIQKILTQADSRLAETYENVTIIYADICGFTAYSSNKNPKEVVSMLSKLFTNFDKKCAELQMYKVYTIGDCYVALGFLDKSNRLEPQLEAYKSIMFAFHMIEIIENVRKEIQFDELNMRIGLHFGNIIGGVIGSDIIRFDIYGEDVMLANKMESEGEKGRINISEDLKNILQQYYDEFEYQEQNILEHQGKKKRMFFVNKKSIQQD